MDKKVSDKKERLLAALDQGMVMIHLDARRPGVLVPASLRGEAHLRLNLSYRFEPPDLTVGEWGVRCTLSFSGSRFTVAVPWSALFAIASHVTKEFWMYPEEMPPELLQQPPVASASVARPPQPAPVPVAAERPRAFLREVQAEHTEEPESRPEVAPPPPPEGGPPDEPQPPRRGHLRLVK
ncbi:stringent starvation protein B [Corallococcus exiguus]|uniref:ClpXP protease specificity-enhancing factor SspB n=1 Tax=Corallococcus TaxID=83461 RepID=UPI000EA0EAAD|nr:MULTISPECIES: ClpXP protease specificity-enhancing factor SspB [Corallococcus]MBN8466114.1 stringent starvation protein B [Corallococcus exiguus]NNC19960.1 stringent starvation protein B [Corallococcus exiguus]NPD28359.1 stringent starvation protein B [Corallococcus exiguus]NRD57357.1 stringent starvation protein B [Corallococcus exiguus]RKH20031.1 stringent starvation protein B [Corallococcus sp. CA041A]